MRVISGRFGSRRIHVPKGVIARPTMDRVREALFSRLEALDAIAGAVVLDAFAGSGALGIEALSRGAAHVTFIERDGGVFRTLKRNLIEFDVQQCSMAIRKDALVHDLSSWTIANPFTLILLDPPYRIDKSEVTMYIERLAFHDLLSDGAYVAWERSSDNMAQWPKGFSSLGHRSYGTTMVDIAVYDKEVA